MTFEELKAEADKQGYNLVKKYEKLPKLEKCPICGRMPKVYRPYLAKDDWYVYCKNHLIGPHVNTSAYYINSNTGNKVYYRTDTNHDLEIMARNAWNDYVNGSIKEESDANS